MSTETIEQPEVTEEPQGEHLDADAIRAEVEAVDVGQFAKDEDERMVLRYMRRRAQVTAEITHVKEQTAAMIRELESKLRGLDWVYTPVARRYAEAKLAGGKARSVKTPFGVAGFRKQPKGVALVDAERAVAALKAAGMKDAIRVKEEPVMAEVTKHFEATGEVLDGFELKEEVDKFSVK